MKFDIKLTKPKTPEQQICLKCGLCCDGTMFVQAIPQKGEKGNLPEKIEKNYKKDTEGEYFKLPCPYLIKNALFMKKSVQMFAQIISANC